MFRSVVAAAEKFEVPEGGWSAVGPMPDVMDVTPAGRPVAAGMSAVPVTGDDCPSHGWGNDPAGPSDVDWFGVGTEDDAADACVTGDPADLLGGEHLTVGGFVQSPAVALQGGQVGVDYDMGLFGSWCLSRVEKRAGQIGEGVGPPLPSRPQITLPRR